jgi:hypothetical protein
MVATTPCPLGTRRRKVRLREKQADSTTRRHSLSMAIRAACWRIYSQKNTVNSLRIIMTVNITVNNITVNDVTVNNLRTINAVNSLRMAEGSRKVPGS